MRRRDREVTDIDEILRIVDKAKSFILVYLIPTIHIVPLHYGYEYRTEILFSICTEPETVMLT